MTLAGSPPPMAWYGSSFVYYEEPKTQDELDAAAMLARLDRLAEFSPEQFGPRPGGEDSTGVVLGRFLPVHDGHRYLIEFARAHAARLHVFVRVGVDDVVPFPVRRDWLAELFPDVTVTAVEDGPEVDPDHWTGQILARVRPDFVFTGDAYGPRLAARLGARFVPVDRDVIPVSGTQVRADPWAWERFLPPPVRAWYTRRVCLIGPEASGKTTLAEQLARHYGTIWVPERLRSAGAGLSPADVALRGHAQQAAEDALARRATRVLICDTDLLSVRLWCERLFGTAPDWMLSAPSSADLYLLTEPDLPFYGADSLNTPSERREFHEACERELVRLGRPYVTIGGERGRRFARAVEAVDALLA